MWERDPDARSPFEHEDAPAVIIWLASALASGALGFIIGWAAGKAW
jgi:hypothetical protein